MKNRVVVPPQMNSPANAGRQHNSPPAIPVIDLNHDELEQINNENNVGPFRVERVELDPNSIDRAELRNFDPFAFENPQPAAAAAPTAPPAAAAAAVAAAATVAAGSAAVASPASSMGLPEALEGVDLGMARFREETRLKAEARRLLDEYCEGAKSTADLQQFNRNYLQCIAESANAFYS